MKYTPEYFKEKFSAIPEKYWNSRHFMQLEKGWVSARRTYCAQGHCGMTLQNKEQVWKAPFNPFVEASALFFMFGGHVQISEDKKVTMVAEINNGDHPQYRQATPKQRVLAAIEDMIKGEYPYMIGPYWEKKKEEITLVEPKKLLEVCSN